MGGRGQFHSPLEQICPPPPSNFGAKCPLMSEILKQTLLHNTIKAYFDLVES